MQGPVDDSRDRRTRKRLATRQAISDVATRLFFERGFDRVSVDEIAQAADVGRMTVFNHFARKEDLFFDRDQELHDLAVGAVRMRAAGVSPIEATRLLAHDLAEQRHPFAPSFEETGSFARAVAASEALKARARQLRDALARSLASALAETVGQPAGDPHSHLAAGLIIASWSVAFVEAQALFDNDRNAAQAKNAFLELVDRGAAGTSAALAKTPYA